MRNGETYVASSLYRGIITMERPVLRVTGRDQINRFVNVCYTQVCNFVKNCHRPSTFIGVPVYFKLGRCFARFCF